MILAADPLDDFLAGAGAGTELGERLQTIGLVLSLPAIVVALGLIAFLSFVHRQASSGERAMILRVVAVCGILTLFGGLIEVAGTIVIGGGTWIEDLTASTRSSLIRLVAGALMFAGFMGFKPLISETWCPSHRLTIGVFGIVVGALSFATDGHTVSRGNALINASLDVVHVLAAGVWVGGIVGLFVLTLLRRRGLETAPLAPTIVRFSTVATLSIVTVAAAGVGMSFLVVDTVGDYFTTSWGRLLLLKVALVAVAAGLGAYNHFVVVPALEVDPADDVMVSRARRTVSAEAGILLAVTLVTVFLTGASINQ